MTVNSIKAVVLNRQRSWALNSRRHTDAHGYLGNGEANLRAPMSARAAAAFENADGCELHGRDGIPAKMRALHSRFRARRERCE